MPVLRSLSAKIIATAVLTTALTLVVGFFLFLRVEREEFTQAVMDEAMQVSSTVLASLERSMMENDNRGTVEIMRALAAANGVDHLLIIDRSATVALSPREAEMGTSLTLPGDVCAVCHGDGPPAREKIFFYTREDGTEVFRNLVPILNKEECRSCHRERFLGLLVTDIRAAGLGKHLVSQLNRFVVLALVIFVVISLSLGFIVDAVVRRPVKRFIKGTQEMAKGRYDLKVELTSGDELGLLADSFNLMAEQVRKSRKVLENWNISLEEEVERRTEELKRSNLKLEEEKEQTESITHSVVEGILSVSAAGHILLANQQAREILGLKKEDSSGRSLREVLEQSSSRFRTAERLEEFMLVGNPAGGDQIEVEQVAPTHSVFKVSRSRIRGKRAGHRGWVFSFHDVSREREIDEMKTNLVAMVSHELRTPLTAIKGSLSILSGMAGDQAEREEFQEIALSNTDRLIELINNLLDMSRIESGRVFYEHGNFHVEALLRECVEAVINFAERRKVRISIDVEEGIDVVTGDSRKLGQVVINLLSNAIKFSPDSSEVNVTVVSAGEEYLFGVSDRGLGIPLEAQEKVFEKFYQVDMTPMRSIGGSGLGLNICKSIVEGHGGRIWVESRAGEGSRFFFSLPKMEATVPRLEFAGRATEVPAARRILQRVLIVEDEEAVRKVLARFLEEKGFEVIEAATARKALEIARSDRPDCITMDVMLPDLDGFDLTAVLKSDPRTRSIPVVFLTVVENGGQERSRNLGAAAYFTKPVEYERVADMIRSLVPGPEVPGHSILMVDDEPGPIRELGDFLEREGYRVRYAHSGREALEALREESPDVLVLDMEMPGISGRDVICQLKSDARWAGLPIVAMGGGGERHSCDMAIQSGASACLSKPVFPETLSDHIRRFLS